MNTQANTPAPPVACTLMRPADVSRITGMKRSTLYNYIDKGTFPRPVKLGERFAVWPFDEVQAILNARIAGKGDDEIRVLVGELMEARKHRA